MFVLSATSINNYLPYSVTLQFPCVRSRSIGHFDNLVNLHVIIFDHITHQRASAAQRCYKNTNHVSLLMTAESVVNHFLWISLQ